MYFATSTPCSFLVLLVLEEGRIRCKTWVARLQIALLLLTFSSCSASRKPQTQRLTLDMWICAVATLLRIRAKGQILKKTTSFSAQTGSFLEIGGKLVGRAFYIVWVSAPQGCLFTSTLWEGWGEKYWGDSGGGLLLLFQCNLSHKFLKFFIRSAEDKNAFILPFSPARFISWMTFQFNKSSDMSCRCILLPWGSHLFSKKHIDRDKSRHRDMTMLLLRFVRVY